MDYNSIFDIIGPIMVGPSSSHTAGAAKIGGAVYKLFKDIPVKAEITFFGSFVTTYQGHGSDVAVIGGLLGFLPSDKRIRQAIKLAKESGLEIDIKTSNEETNHPNTILIKAISKNGEKISVVGSSIGGGKINIEEINGFKANLSCDNPTLLVFHKDRFGVIADVSMAIALKNINIGHMEVSRKSKGEDALMIIEVDNATDNALIDLILDLNNVTKVEII